MSCRVCPDTSAQWMHTALQISLEEEHYRPPVSPGLCPHLPQLHSKSQNFLSERDTPLQKQGNRQHSAQKLMIKK